MISNGHFFFHLNLDSTHHKSKISLCYDAAISSPLAFWACGKRRCLLTDANQLTTQSAAASPSNYFRLTAGENVIEQFAVNPLLRKTQGKLRRHLPPQASMPEKVVRLILAPPTTLKATVVGWKGNSGSANRVIHSKDCRKAVSSWTWIADMCWNWEPLSVSLL